MKKRLIALFAAFLMLAGCFGCRGKNETSKAGEQPDSAGAYRDTVNIGIQEKITTLDPQAVNNQVHTQLFYCIYETLVNYDYENAKVVAGVAEDWTWNEDYTSITFRLRKDARFSNGTPLTSKDAAFMLERNTNAQITSYLDHCETPDEHTLVMVLSAPYTDMLCVLTTAYCCIVSKDAVEADAEHGAAIGSGPWAVDMENTVLGDTVTLVRNEHYAGQKPVTQTLRFRTISNDSSRLIALQNDEVQMITGMSAAELSNAEADPNITVYRYPTSILFNLQMNQKDGPCTDEDLRLAIAYAIDRTELDAAMGGGFTPAVSFYNFAAEGYFTEFDTDISYDPEKAKQYAQKAGNPSLVLTANTSNALFSTTAQMLQEELRRVGITVEINEVDSAGLTAATKYDGNTTEAVLYSVSLNNWGSDIGRLLLPGSNANKGVVNDPKLSELIAAMSATADAQKAAEAAKAAQIYVHDHAIVIPLLYSTGMVAWRNGVEGIVIAPNQYHVLKDIAMPAA